MRLKRKNLGTLPSIQHILASCISRNQRRTRIITYDTLLQTISGKKLPNVSWDCLFLFFYCTGMRYFACVCIYKMLDCGVKADCPQLSLLGDCPPSESFKGVQGSQQSLFRKDFFHTKIFLEYLEQISFGVNLNRLKNSKEKFLYWKTVCQNCDLVGTRSVLVRIYASFRENHAQL